MAKYKFNNGNAALVCSCCSAIIKTGSEFTEIEKDEYFNNKSNLTPSQFCDECKKNTIWSIYAGSLNTPVLHQFYNGKQEDAEVLAYQLACDDYESYQGLHGTFNYEDALDENPDLTEEELFEMECEDRENWIEYYVEEYKIEHDEDL